MNACCSLRNLVTPEALGTNNCYVGIVESGLGIALNQSGHHRDASASWRAMPTSFLDGRAVGHVLGNRGELVARRMLQEGVAGDRTLVKADDLGSASRPTERRVAGGSGPGCMPSIASSSRCSNCARGYPNITHGLFLSATEGLPGRPNAANCSRENLGIMPNVDWKGRHEKESLRWCRCARVHWPRLS